MKLRVIETELGEFYVQEQRPSRQYGPYWRSIVSFRDMEKAEAYMDLLVVRRRSAGRDKEVRRVVREVEA